MDLMDFTSYNQLRNAFINQFDADETHIDIDYGTLKAEGVYTLRCGSDSVYTFPAEETDRGMSMLTHNGVQMVNLRENTADWGTYDSVEDWAVETPSVVDRFSIEELSAVESGDKTLYYVGRGGVMPERIWAQLNGTGAAIPRIFPPVAVVNVHWLDAVGEETLEALEERVVREYRSEHDRLVVATA